MDVDLRHSLDRMLPAVRMVRHRTVELLRASLVDNRRLQDLAAEQLPIEIRGGLVVEANDRPDLDCIALGFRIGRRVRARPTT